MDLKYLEKTKPIFVIPEEITPMLEGLDITEDTRIRKLFAKDHNTRIKGIHRAPRVLMETQIS